MILRPRCISWCRNGLLTLITLPGLAANPSAAVAAGIQIVDLGEVPRGNLQVPVVQVAELSAGLTQMTVAPKWDALLFFSDRDGQVYRVDPRNGSSDVFLDLNQPGVAPNFQNQDPRTGRGLRGLAFHPDFNTPNTRGYGKFFTTQKERFNSGDATHALASGWQRSTRQDSVLVEWTYDHASGQVDTTSYRQVMRVQYPYGDHVMQQIAFNPAATAGEADYGKLFVTLGDGGGPTSGGPGVDSNRVGQDTTNVLASILRIDPLQQGEQSFSVPDDNPWVGDPVTLDEIYAHGFRHPQTIGFDPADGRMFVGDIGQNNVEEINLIEPGRNYGWSDREGTYLFTDRRLPAEGQEADMSLREVLLDGSQLLEIQQEGGAVLTETIVSRVDDPYTYPVAQLDHLNNNRFGQTAVVGGHVYRGSLLPELEGLYLFGNLSSNKVYYAPSDQLINDEQPIPFQWIRITDAGGTPTNFGDLIGNPRTLMRLGQDAFGELYLFSQRNGLVFRFGLDPELPADFDQDGDVDDDDLFTWSSHFGQPSGAALSTGDTDRDGDVDGKDFLAWQNQFGQTPPTAPAHQVPEPAAIVMLVLSLVALPVGRRRRGALQVE